MRLSGDLGQLTYCTNIHPGESLAEVRDALTRHASQVRELVAPHAPFGVGLRLSARAAEELAQREAMLELKQLLHRLGLYVFTLNGFPYGQFHGTRVKERVYLPDWRQPERLAYTANLARILAALLPDDLTLGSISTVPGAFKQGLQKNDAARVASALGGLVIDLVRLEHETGRRIVIALEPEPCCMLETIAETVSFFERELWSERVVAPLCSELGLSTHDARAVLRRHIGVCLDLCHAAVEFEDLPACLQHLRRAGIEIAKLQISSGLVLNPQNRDARRALASFRDEVYLHQVIARTPAGLLRFADIGDAEAAFERDIAMEEWRIHFHVPLFHAKLPHLQTTQSFVRAALERHRLDPISPHLEVETYTWQVLPSALRDLSVSTCIAHELEWVESELRA